jgi:predicted 3-demethylubiquinone-9 3-methyltransferase (glyoxalase superfamily)
MPNQQKIKTFLWFDKDAEEAVNHYTAAFKDSKTVNVERYGDAGPGPKGEVMLVEFTLAGQHFLALNGRPQFKPNDAVSLMVTAEDQAEVDRLWDHLLQGGAPLACGWLRDRWGFSWQIVPKRMLEMMADKDAERKNRVFAAMMQMIKFDVAALEKAYAGT